MGSLFQSGAAKVTGMPGLGKKSPAPPPETEEMKKKRLREMSDSQRKAGAANSILADTPDLGGGPGSL